MQRCGVRGEEKHDGGAFLWRAGPTERRVSRSLRLRFLDLLLGKSQLALVSRRHYSAIEVTRVVFRGVSKNKNEHAVDEKLERLFRGGFLIKEEIGGRNVDLRLKRIVMTLLTFDYADPASAIDTPRSACG
jgi:hypothetical protein